MISLSFLYLILALVSAAAAAGMLVGSWRERALRMSRTHPRRRPLRSATAARAAHVRLGSIVLVAYLLVAAVATAGQLGRAAVLNSATDARLSLAHRYDRAENLALGRASVLPVVDATRGGRELARLGGRADEIYGALDPIARTRRTTAVLGTREGPDVLAGGARDLSPAQRALARPGDVLGRAPGQHAEITALKAASEAGLTPRGIATTTRICPSCQAAIEESGATITGPTTAWWP